MAREITLVHYSMCYSFSRKGGRVERDQESRVSQNSEDVAGNKLPLPGLLPVDVGLWTHISHTREHIRTLNTVEEQVQQLAK